MRYDAQEDLYWMTYDWGTGRLIPQKDGKFCQECLPDSGVALAWAKSPEGPFHQLKTWVHNNRFPESRIGRFDRGYSSSAFRRKNDWICFIMQDSGPHHGWGLTCRTAKTPDGEWSKPHLLLSPDRQDYYPALMEYCFCVQIGDKIYAPATSVAGNRNYQLVYAADLEQAEHPSAWKLVREGSLWHSRPLADERYGIWGQTLHGFVEDGKYYTMYVGMDERKHGTLSVASCPVERPFRDGFTISGHVGSSISPTLVAYRDFALDMQMNFTGTVEVFLKHHGILGPDRSTSDSVTSEESFAASFSVELSDNRVYRLLLRDSAGKCRVLEEGRMEERITSMEAIWMQNRLQLMINGREAWAGNLALVLADAGMDPETFAQAPLAVCAHQVSVLNCSRFRVTGEVLPYTLRYSAMDGVLAAMHGTTWQPAQQEGFLTQKGYIGEGTQWVKWNFRGNGFRLYAPKRVDLGLAEIWVDGYLYATVDLHAPQAEASRAVYETRNLPGESHHAVVLKGYEGQPFAVDILEALGEPIFKEIT